MFLFCNVYVSFQLRKDYLYLYLYLYHLRKNPHLVHIFLLGVKAWILPDVTIRGQQCLNGLFNIISTFIKFPFYRWNGPAVAPLAQPEFSHRFPKALHQGQNQHELVLQQKDWQATSIFKMASMVALTSPAEQSPPGSKDTVFHFCKVLMRLTPQDFSFSLRNCTQVKTKITYLITVRYCRSLVRYNVNKERESIVQPSLSLPNAKCELKSLPHASVSYVIPNGS